MNEQTTWIWGRHAVLEALRAGSVRQVLYARERVASAAVQEVTRLASARRITLRDVPDADIRRIAGRGNAQGVAAQTTQRRLDSIRQLLEHAQKSERVPLVLVLDQIQDPHNLGALLRTADAAGVHAVVVPERGSAPLGGTVAKTSAGAMSHVPILAVKNLARALRELKDAGMWVVGLDAFTPHSIFEADLRDPLALVVGGEGTGLRRLTRDSCDVVVSLPMLGSVESLNASVAGAVAMYEILRQRSHG